MIKTTAIILTAAASLGANTTTPPAMAKPATPAHFEITTGPLNILRENGVTHFKVDASSTSLLRIELASGKTLNIQL